MQVCLNSTDILLDSISQNSSSVADHNAKKTSWKESSFMPAIQTSVRGPATMTFENVVHGLRYEPISFVTNLLSSYGDIVRLPFGERDLYLLGNPKFIREIFLDPSGSFAKRKDPDAEQRYLND